jgi:hypothetical protein
LFLHDSYNFRVVYRISYAILWWFSSQDLLWMFNRKGNPGE